MKQGHTVSLFDMFESAVGALFHSPDLGERLRPMVKNLQYRELLVVLDSLVNKEAI